MDAINTKRVPLGYIKSEQYVIIYNKKVIIEKSDIPIKLYRVNNDENLEYFDCFENSCKAFYEITINRNKLSVYSEIEDYILCNQYIESFVLVCSENAKVYVEQDVFNDH